MKKIFKRTEMKNITLEGMMTFGMTQNGLHTMDFQCCEDASLEGFSGNCKVQAMRDGNVYMQQKPKRVRNKPIFRDDNSSLSLGRNSRYYFVFSMPSQRADELPEELVRQACAIAKKMVAYLSDIEIVDRL